MRILAVVALAASLSGFEQQPSAQTPQDCVRAGRDFASQKQRESAPLTAEKVRAIDSERIAKDKTYFAGYGFDIPIAIGPDMFTMVDGKRVVAEDPVEKGFGVSGIPQINVIDAKGKIRLIMIGYDDANEEKLASFIEKVLAER